MSPKQWPTFDPSSSLHDLGSFRGRLFHFCDVIDPRTLFTSKKRLAECVELLERFRKNGRKEGVSDEDLWKALKITQAIIHPDTGKVIPIPFRMSGFVPFGSPMIVGMLLPNNTLASTVFWQWINQSHNACVNYANRNASKHTPFHRYIGGYVGAVSSALAIAVSLNVLIKKSVKMGPLMKMVVTRFVPFPAVVTASTCNILLMRKNELSEGIEVTDKEGQVVGTSQVAAKQALAQTALTRMILPTPIFLIAPACMTFLERMKCIMTRPRLLFPLNCLVYTATFAISLPIALAIFPQYSSISRELLEKEIQTSTNEALLYYNKGL